VFARTDRMSRGVAPLERAHRSGCQWERSRSCAVVEALGHRPGGMRGATIHAAVERRLGRPVSRDTVLSLPVGVDA